MAICDEALTRIGQAIKNYLKEHDDKYPSSLQELEELDMISYWDMVCPVCPYGYGEISYVYRGDDLLASHPEEMIVAFDVFPNHKGRRNILFASGKVQRPPEKLFESMIKKDNEYRKLLNLPEKKSPEFRNKTIIPE